MSTKTPSMTGHRLRAYRERAKLSQTQLAQMSGVARTMISNVENGHRGGFSMESLIKLASALGLSVDQLCRPEPLETRDVGSP